MIEILIAILVFVVVYAVAKFLLVKVDPIAEIADILALAIGAVAAIVYSGAL